MYKKDEVKDIVRNKNITISCNRVFSDHFLQWVVSMIIFLPCSLCQFSSNVLCAHSLPMFSVPILLPCSLWPFSCVVLCNNFLAVFSVIVLAYSEEGQGTDFNKERGSTSWDTGGKFWHTRIHCETNIW